MLVFNSSSGMKGDYLIYHIYYLLLKRIVAVDLSNSWLNANKTWFSLWGTTYVIHNMLIYTTLAQNRKLMKVEDWLEIMIYEDKPYNMWAALVVIAIEGLKSKPPLRCQQVVTLQSSPSKLQLMPLERFSNKRLNCPILVWEYEKSSYW